MFIRTKNSLAKSLTQFWSDESGQGAVEFAGMCVLGAVLAYFAWNQITTTYNPTSTVQNEFNGFFANLSNF